MADGIVVETARLVVRDWTGEPADRARIFDIYSRWEVARWLGREPRAMADPAEVDETLARWHGLAAQSDGRYGIWAIEVRDTGVVAGTVLFKFLPNSDGSPATDLEVGWHLHPDSWGHGYATESARAVIDRELAVSPREVFAVVKPGNSASAAVCRRLGMAELGQRDTWYSTDLLTFRLAPT